MVPLLTLLALLVAACTREPIGGTDRIVLHRQDDPHKFDAAQLEAEQICAARGRRARFVSIQPQIIYDCVPQSDLENYAGN